MYCVTNERIDIAMRDLQVKNQILTFVNHFQDFSVLLFSPIIFFFLKKILRYKLKKGQQLSVISFALLPKCI